MLRGSGFASEALLRLSQREIGASIDAYLDKKRRNDDAQQDALALCQQHLAPLRGKDRKPLARIIKRLKRGEVAAPDAQLPEPLNDKLLVYGATRTALHQHREDLQALYTKAQSANSRALRLQAQDPRFQEALLWQNPKALETGVQRMLATPENIRNSKARQRELLVASYLQRYRVKNDTIGFFGPVAWARFGAPQSQLLDERTALKQRRVYFEYWAIDALAQQLNQDERLRPDLPPRLAPHVRVHEGVLHHPIERQSKLPEALSRLLGACDGQKTAREIAVSLGEDEEELFEMLDEMVAQNIVFWELEIPTTALFPERHLLRAIERVQDEKARSEARDRFQRLSDAKDAIAEAAGAPRALRAALHQFEEVFTQTTGESAERKQGEHYAGRTPIFEDCLRGQNLEVGPEVLAPLSAPLTLLSLSARWFTYEIAKRYQAAFLELFASLSKGASSVDYQRFWGQARALFPGDAPRGSIVGDVRQQLQERWSRLLLSPNPERQIQHSASDLMEPVKSAFDAPEPGWPSARFHSPDVMICAPSVEAFAEAQFVLGELHASFNTVSVPWAFKEHPEPEHIKQALQQDLPNVCVAPVWSKARSRADYYSMAPHDLELEDSRTRSGRPRAQVLKVASLRIESDGDRLIVCDLDGELRIDLIAFVERHLIAESFAHFSILPLQAHTPRIAIDRLVISREGWSFTPDELPFLMEKNPLEQAILLREWANTKELPRHLFYRVPEESKPYYLDMESPIFVEMFLRTIHKSSALYLSEMLPQFEQLWLKDQHQERFTSELRLAVLDPVPFLGKTVHS